MESLNIVIDLKEDEEKKIGNLFNLLLEFNKIDELKELYESINRLIDIVKKKKFYKTLD